MKIMINVGMIGTGRMGNVHASNLKNMPNVKLRGVYDINPEKSKEYAKDFGAEIFSDPASLVACKDINLIMICSPTYAHIEGIMAAVPTKKAIFCEKPLCRTEAELNVLAPIISSYEGFFAIGFVRRYSSVVKKIKEMLEAGAIGKPICGEVRILLGAYGRKWGDWFTDYSLSGGVMLDMLAHHADLQNHFIGEAESVYARALMLDRKQELPCDFVSATVVYKSGYISNMECSWLRSGPSDNSMTIYGDKGALLFSDSTGLTFFTPGKSEQIKLEGDKIENVQENPNGDMYMNEMLCLVDVLKNDKKPDAGADSAITAMKFCSAMMKSAETKQIVTL